MNSEPTYATAKPLSGQDVLAYLAGIERAMDEAGGGQFRAFKLLSELDRMGLGIVATEMPAIAPTKPAQDEQA